MRRLVSVLLAAAVALPLALTGAVALVVAAPGVASAHDVLERTDPADGTTVERLPGAVSLTFSEDPLTVGTQVVVTGPDGPVQSGAPTVDGRVVRQALAADAPGGDYTVTYRVTSGDGHPVSGTFGFHATVGLDGSTATAPATAHVRPAEDPSAAASSPFVPVLLTVVGTTVLLVVGGVVLLRGRSSSTS